MTSARWRFTDRIDGDMADPVVRDAILGPGGVWLRQVHGARVVTVTEPGEHCGAEADGAVTNLTGVPLMVRTADCAPVILSAEGMVGVAHAGWRGLAAGVIEGTLAAMVALGAEATGLTVRVGPLIRPRCYEFGAADLGAVAGSVGPEVRSQTAWGAPALDTAAGITAVLGRAGVAVGQVIDGGTCTACSPHHFSHRVNADTGRQAALAWLEPTP